MTYNMKWLGALYRKAYLAIPERYRPIVVALLVWFVLTAVFVLQTGVVPRTQLGWLIIATLGPILCAAGAIAITVVVALLARVTGAAERDNGCETGSAQKPSQFSQIAFRLTLVLLFGAGIVLAAYLTQLRDTASAPASWFRQNFTLH